MRILVTGGAGFIGSHYGRTLLADSYPGFESARRDRAVVVAGAGPGGGRRVGSGVYGGEDDGPVCREPGSEPGRGHLEHDGDSYCSLRADGHGLSIDVS